MKKSFFIALSFFCLPVAHGSEVGFTQTRSPTAIGRRVKFAYDFSPTHKLSMLLKKSSITLDVDDTSSGSLQGIYQYRRSNVATYNFSVKSSDEIYQYQSSMASLRASFSVVSGTSLLIGAGLGRRQYSPSSSEDMAEQALHLGFEQEIGDRLTLGAAVDFENYQTSGRQTSRVFQGLAVLTADISSYVSLLLSRSRVLYLETDWEPLTIGMSYTEDAYAFNSAISKTFELYGDILFGQSWLLGVFWAQGRPDVTTDTEPVKSSGLSVSYMF